MPEVIVFPDIEALVCDHLRSTLVSYAGTAVHVATRAPEDADEFVLVRKTGGSDGRNIVQAVEAVTLECYADGEPRAARLAQLCRGLLGAMDVVNGVQVYRIQEYAAPSNLPDPNTNQARYTATYAIRVRGRAE